MITPSYVRTMVAYNGEMNSRLYTASSRLTDVERKADRGVFWKSIHGTLVHLLWGDRLWMSRFDGWPRPAVGVRGSADMIDDFETLSAERVAADSAMKDWAQRLTMEWLADDMIWYSDTLQREMRTQRAFLVMHLVNHQTHHRGQIHALLTAFGQATGDTDLFLVIEPRQ